MEKQDRQVLLGPGFLKGVLVFSAFFAVLLVLIILAGTFYFPDYVLHHYLTKSRTLARSLSQSIQDVRVFGGENTLKKIVRLNFPQEENIVNIVVRDLKGTMTYQNTAPGESLSFAEALSRNRSVVEDVIETSPDKVQVVQLRSRSSDSHFYKISSPIYRDGVKIGDVSVGISKRQVSSKMELTRGQLKELAFVIALSLVFVLLVSYFISIRFFLKFKRSELRASQLKHMAYVGELSSGLAHEIRNPLNTMSINLQLLRESIRSGDTEKVDSKISVLERAKNHAADVLTQFMDFAKYKPARTEVFDLLKLVRNVVAMVEEDLKEKRIELVLEIPPGGLNIEANQQELSGMLFNLVLNAMDALDALPAAQDRRELRIIAAAQKKDLRLAVVDTGEGMDDFTRAHVFTPFFSKKKKGTGLGMAMVKRIVDEYQGTITIDSSPGAGTRIEIMIEGVVRH